MPNFNSTVVGVRYSRVMNMVIDYYAERSANVSVVLLDHVLMADGTHEPLGSARTIKFTITKDTLTSMVSIRDVDTGALLGIEMPMMHIFSGINAVIRAEEVRLEMVEAAQVISTEPVEQIPE